MDHDFFVRREGSVLRARGLSMMGIALISICALLSSAGCSPYPMYTHGTVAARHEAAAGSGAASEKGTKTTRAPGQAWETASSVDPTIMSRVVNQYAGIPYKKGGDDERGYDCSHLVRAIYRDYSGTRLPASTRALYMLPQEVSPEEIAVGDLVFFSFDGNSVAHVGVYMGGGRFVHASESRGVIFSSLSDPEFREAYKGARRVL